jgi:ATP-dependent DNA helicase RecQ
VQDLAAAGYLARGEERTSGYSLTDRGRLLLRGKETFLAPRRPERAAKALGPETAEPPGLDGPAAERLFQVLKVLRKRLAQERNVPPYVVFSDKTLRAMAISRPTTPAVFLRCPGVGERKLDAYGEEFIGAVREFLAQAPAED